MNITIRYQYDKKYYAFAEDRYGHTQCEASENSFEEAEEKLIQAIKGIQDLEIPEPKTITI